MFYGLNKLIKNLLPKKLFYRALLIVAIPVIALQLLVTIVFFDSLWIKTNKGMTRALISEIDTFIVAFDNEDNNKDYIIDLFSIYLNLNIKYLKNKNFDFELNERWFSPVDRSLRRELKSSIGNDKFWFSTTNYLELINIRIKYKDGYFEFLVPRDRVTSSSARLFGLWISVPAIFLIFVAIIFLKNQTRPITNLAKAAEKFGRGEDVGDYRPSGSLEIRQAGYEFDKMRKRILRHLNQRSEMLSGISHDLRTPLTRIKLQIAMIKDKSVVEKLSGDVDEMEKMLNEYLQFARSGAKDKTETFDISVLLEDICKKYEKPNIKYFLKERVYFDGRKNLISRCINNLIDNSLKFADNVELYLKKGRSTISISIEDDGPGIPQKEHQNVLKPFYKIDKSRSETKSSVGLGLAISSDVVKSHGGDLKFDKSSLGGLKVIISLPV